MRRPIIMAEPDIAAFPADDVKTAIVALGRYLVDDYFPKDMGSFSRHALMGPAGKMLEVLQSGRIRDREALLGYVTQIHNQSASYQLSADGLEHLQAAADAIMAIRQRSSERQWIRALREIGHGVYLIQYAAIQERFRKKKQTAADTGNENEDTHS